MMRPAYHARELRDQPDGQTRYVPTDVIATASSAHQLSATGIQQLRLAPRPLSVAQHTDPPGWRYVSARQAHEESSSSLHCYYGSTGKRY